MSYEKFQCNVCKNEKPCIVHNHLPKDGISLFDRHKCYNGQNDKIADFKPADMDIDNIDDRWTLIGKLVEKHGTEDEKIAWALCRGDAADGSCVTNFQEKK